MENAFLSIFSVKINFAESHMVFPVIIMWCLGLLSILIFVFNIVPYLYFLYKKRQKIKVSVGFLYKARLIGTLVLTIAYFKLMEFVGAFFPNMGYGFLFVSMIFIFFLSLLYVHNINLKKFLTIVANAILSPSVAWLILAQLFNITLP